MKKLFTLILTFSICALSGQDSHAAARGGNRSGSLSGTLTEDNLSLSDVVTGNSSTSQHGFLRKLTGDTDAFLNGNGAWSKVAESGLTLADNTTNNASTSKHGFMRKLDNDATHFFDGTGAWAAITEAKLTLADNTTGDATTARHGLLPKLDDDALHFLDGDGVWSAITEAKLTLADNTTSDVSTLAHGFAPKLPGDADVFLNGNGAYTAPFGVTMLTATATLNFPSNSGGIGSSDSLTVTVTGAAVGDSVALGVPTGSTVSFMVFYTAYVSAADTVTVVAHNLDAGVVDPASGSFRVTVFHY